MDEYDENSMMSPVALPSKIPSPHRGLSEMSSTDTNTRILPPSSLRPPMETPTFKPKYSSLPEPSTKRKTLAERAGEVSRPIGQHAFSYSTSAVQPTSLANARNPSLSSSVSSRSTTTTSSSHSSRPASASSLRRPQTTRANSRSAMPPPSSTARPASAMAGNLAGGTKSTLGKRKGTNSLSLALPKTRNRGAGKGSMTSVEDSTRRPQSALLIRPEFPTAQSLRDFSLSSAMRDLNINSDQPMSVTKDVDVDHSISSIPKPSPAAVVSRVIETPKTPSRIMKPKGANSPKKLPFLTRDSTLVWDTEARFDHMESLYTELKEKMSGTANERNSLQETVSLYKDRINELEMMRSQLSADNVSLKKQLAESEDSLKTATIASNNERQEFERELRGYLNQMEDIERQHRRDFDDQDRSRREVLDKAERDAREGLSKAQREAQDTVDDLIRRHQNELRELERRMHNQMEEEKAEKRREVQQLNLDMSTVRGKAAEDLGLKAQEIIEAKEELDKIQATMETKELLIKNLRNEVAETSSKLINVEATSRAQKARIDFLESDSSAQAQSFADAEQRMQDAIQMAEEFKQKLRKEETLRRMLHNQVQELKGNIRVFCRVRPALSAEANDSAKIDFPDAELDSKEINLMGSEEKSSLGTVTTKKHSFAFDKVFAPASQNEEIFDEISQLVQSALDGYNVCIFCYGQTGAGKTHTMLAPDGMVPRAVNQIYESTLALEEKGWKYTMEGSFVEVYNENLNDLLGKPNELDKKKHEIHNDQQKRTTTITGVTVEALDSAGKVELMLKKASANRSVAATKANERSSRSHSVFILKLKGENRGTGESSEGTLNLVDLAGSERLSQSQATGDRLKETQSINKSLSALGDVISALGQNKASAHVPYRNSKLTELLQFSLGGNSKTLMFVMVSPLQAHLNETLTSLKFATRVHNTHIGTAKKQSKAKE